MTIKWLLKIPKIEKTTGQMLRFYDFESQEKQGFGQKIWRYPRFLRPFGRQLTWVCGAKALSLCCKLNALMPLSGIFRSSITSLSL